MWPNDDLYDLLIAAEQSAENLHQSEIRCFWHWFLGLKDQINVTGSAKGLLPNLQGGVL